MTTTTESSLKKLHTRLAPGAPVTMHDLAALGISADLAGYYVRAGWLLRLGRRTSMRRQYSRGSTPRLQSLGPPRADLIPLHLES
jgi:hypothetical protein